MSAANIKAAPSLIEALNRRIFSVAMALGILVFSIIVIRGLFVTGHIPLSDAVNALALALVWMLHWKKPEWYKVLTWLAFATFLANIYMDGINFSEPVVITSTHILLPLLVLYGTLLANRNLTACALAIVLGLYAFTGWNYYPIDEYNTFLLTNLAILSLALGFASMVTWSLHRRLLEALQRRARDLRRELDVNHHLTAVLYHDIANPLSAAQGSIELLKAREKWDKLEFDRLDRMTGRVNSVVRAVRSFHQSRSATERVARVKIRDLWNDLGDLFGEQMGTKGQVLELIEGGDLSFETRPDLLVNSVLGNLLSNAIEHSAGNSILRMSASAFKEGVSIELADQGGGIPAQVLESFMKGERFKRESDGVSGHGLWIARFFVDQLGGRLTFEKTEGGTRAILDLPPEPPEPPVG